MSEEPKQQRRKPFVHSRSLTTKYDVVDLTLPKTMSQINPAPLKTEQKVSSVSPKTQHKINSMSTKPQDSINSVSPKLQRNVSSVSPKTQHNIYPVSPKTQHEASVSPKPRSEVYSAPLTVTSSIRTQRKVHSAPPKTQCKDESVSSKNSEVKSISPKTQLKINSIPTKTWHKSIAISAASHRDLDCDIGRASFSQKSLETEFLESQQHVDSMFPKTRNRLDSISSEFQHQVDLTLLNVNTQQQQQHTLNSSKTGSKISHRKNGTSVYREVSKTPPVSSSSTPKKTVKPTALEFLVTGKQILRRSDRANSLPGSSRQYLDYLQSKSAATKTPSTSPSRNEDISSEDEVALGFSEMSDDENATSRCSQLQNTTFTISTPKEPITPKLSQRRPPLQLNYEPRRERDSRERELIYCHREINHSSPERDFNYSPLERAKFSTKERELNLMQRERRLSSPWNRKDKRQSYEVKDRELNYIPKQRELNNATDKDSSYGSRERELNQTPRERKLSYSQKELNFSRNLYLMERELDYDPRDREERIVKRVEEKRKQFSCSVEDSVYRTASTASNNRYSPSDLEYSSASPERSLTTSASGSARSGYLGNETNKWKNKTNEWKNENNEWKNETNGAGQWKNETNEAAQWDGKMLNGKKAGEWKNEANNEVGEWNSFWMNSLSEQAKEYDQCPTPFARSEEEFSTTSALPVPSNVDINLEGLTLTRSETENILKCAHVLGNVLTKAVERQSKDN